MARSEKCASRGILLCATGLLASAGIYAGSAHAASLAIGPVEQVNLKSSTIVVLGQTYHVGSPAQISDRATGSVVALSSLTPGTLVAVDGTESASGKTAIQNVVRLAGLDVPGATQLLVTGVVSAESKTGQVRIGNLRVDINATLTSDSQQPTVGQLVQIVGTQPTSRGLFLAQGIAGTGQSSNGIAGTGDSTNGIAGTGQSSNGIAGTGASANGIAGTGLSANGIAGTGPSSNGIAGTGASAKGIAGTGLSANGIAGTGLSSNGIAGTGASANGIAGTGLSSNGIAGTGTSAKGIAGTGTSAKGIAGTGLSANGIAGTGLSSSGIAGTGASAQGIAGTGVN